MATPEPRPTYQHFQLFLRNNWLHYLHADDNIMETQSVSALQVH